MSLAFLTVVGAPACAATEEEEALPGETESSTDAVQEIVAGPLVKETDAAVWTVENQWADTTTAQAKRAGLAWGESSGLTWEEKFQKWIGSFERVSTVDNYAMSIRLPTPWGKKADGPALECADIAIWLRMTFASWYHLPFYVQGYVKGRPIYMGHFGVIDKDGQPWAGFPRFRAQYKDYEPTWRATDAWPTDAQLASKSLGYDDRHQGLDIGGTKLPEGAKVGAYLDKVFLNKRAAYLMIVLDNYFGTANLADGANMFHVTVEGVAPGDTLVKRYRRNGVGHALPVMTVERPKADKYRMTVASGSMPRRQASWETEAESGHYFSDPAAGGEGESDDEPPVPYAKLGGGVRRWRTAVIARGRWTNVVPERDRPFYIADVDLAAIAGRQKRFEELLAEESPEARRDAALAIIASARSNLRRLPASCSTRTKREEAFEQLYVAMAELGTSRTEVDAEHRTLEDYVLAELDYNRSKTCCWNSTTAAMGEIILGYAEKEKAEADAAKTCKQPTVFGARGGNFDVWKTYAESIGRGADWKPWTEDEPCTQRDSVDDAVTERGSVAMCR